MDKTLEDFDHCQFCDQHITWMNFVSTCSRCEEELSEDYEPGDRDEDLFWDEGM